jgi:hypothetical protein
MSLSYPLPSSNSSNRRRTVRIFSFFKTPEGRPNGLDPSLPLNLNLNTSRINVVGVLDFRLKVQILGQLMQRTCKERDTKLTMLKSTRPMTPPKTSRKSRLFIFVNKSVATQSKVARMCVVPSEMVASNGCTLRPLNWGM